MELIKYIYIYIYIYIDNGPYRTGKHDNSALTMYEMSMPRVTRVRRTLYVARQPVMTGHLRSPITELTISIIRYQRSTLIDRHLINVYRLLHVWLTLPVLYTTMYIALHKRSATYYIPNIH